ncbi:MAG: hypothetical protein CBD18_05330 [Opitutales bacterium TMED158]|nr:MAG: hypothetical protein CBD18_05330 [Opitutales bacterium TMED158]
MKTRRIVIFGGGKGGIRALKALKADERVVAFCDNDSRKQGARLAGRPIVGPLDLANIDFDSILIASQYSESILQQLESMETPYSKIELLAPEILAGKKPGADRLDRWKAILGIQLARIAFAVCRLWKRLKGDPV